MSTKEYKSFIFDLDGTLFTIPVDWQGVRAELAALTGGPMDGSPLFLRLEELIAERPSLKSEAFSIIDAHELRAADRAEPLPGAVDLLYALFEIGTVALVPLQGRQALDRILQKHGLSELFEATISREESLDRAGQLTIALGRLGRRPSDALFMGDRLNDVVCARRVGVDVALVGRGVQGDLRPDYSFPSLVELKSFVA